MNPKSKEEQIMALYLRKATGKSMETCVFCLRYNRGNYRKALKMCSQTPALEGERCWLVEEIMA